MHATWILVADRSRARLFCADIDDDGKSFTELEDFVNTDGRKPGQGYAYDHPPRTMESMGGASHVIQPHTTPEDKVAQRFAGELSDVLERGRAEQRYERLILAAPPRFLGTLQHALGKQVSACVVAHLDKDLTTLPAVQIQHRVAVASGKSAQGRKP
jgi:protein required for attachment to host cells